MKKIFTLAAAVLASFSLWAADPTLPADAIPSTTLDAKVLDTDNRCITNEVHNSKQYYVYSFDTVRSQMKAGVTTWVKGPKNDGGNSATISFASDDAEVNYGFTDKGTKAWGINNSRYVGIRVKNCVEFAALTKSNSTKDGKTLYIHVFKKNADNWDFVETIGEDVYNNSKYYVLKATLDAAEEYVILLTSGNSSNCLTAQIRFASPYCEDPEFTVNPTEGTGFVGDPIDLAITSKNNSKPVNYAVTIDGVAGEIGTDYSFNVSPGLVQATPLKAGTFEITFSQASDGTYCDAEESATFVISEKTPVTSFEIDAPATAHVGEEVTIELKNFDAAPTSIVWYDGALTEITAANGKTSYTFTPEATGKYAFQITAWNDFNELNDEAFNYTEIKVVVGTDATLSDLKVNGATIDGFAADKFEYTIAAELGVYEALKVEATAADAPYASAAVVDNGEGKVTVTVTAEDKSTQDYVINYNRADATLLAQISTSTTWDWTKAGGKTDEQKATGTMPSNAEEFNFADVLKSPDAEFNAAALAGIAQFANRDGYFQGNMVKFNTTVPGTVVVTYSNTGSKRPYRHIKVNETMSAEGSATQDQKSTEAINVSAGDVVITFYIPDATKPQEGNNDKVGPSMGRIYKLVFTADGATAIDNTEAAVKAVKMVENGMLIIKKDGKKYNIIGSVIR